MLIPDDTFQFCCVGISQAGARCARYKIQVLHSVLVSALSQGDHPLSYEHTWTKSTLSCLKNTHFKIIVKVCIYIHVHTCIYVHTCVYTYIYTHFHVICW